MASALIPPDEDVRLAALRRLCILDTEPEERFDRVTRLATRLFDVPISSVTLVDTHRLWFKSVQGLSAREMARYDSFCARTILDDHPLIITDAHGHPEYHQLPVVTQAPHVRFYAGVPLKAPTGERIGSLCIADSKPHTFNHQDRAHLADLGRMVEAEWPRGSTQASFRFLQELMQSVPNPMSFWNADQTCRFANDPYLEWYFLTREQIAKMSVRDVLGDALYTANLPYFNRALEGERQTFERVVPCPDGVTRQLIVHYCPQINDDGSVGGILVTQNDVTELKEAQRALRLAATVLTNTIEGVIITNAAGEILTVNRAFSEITGYSQDEVIGKNPRVLKSHQHSSEFYRQLWHDIEHKGQWQGEIWNRRKSGEPFLEWQSITKITNPDDGKINYVAVFSDITDLWRKNEHLRHLAYHDALTGLPNRSHLVDHLDQRVRIAKREGRTLGILFLDLDGFKAVNDRLGHPVGDQVLQMVANRLGHETRQSDMVARLGGDEFVIVLDNPESRTEITLVVERVIEAINEPMTFGTDRTQVGTSVGIALFPDHGNDAEALLATADTAMYEAKKNGKNAYRYAGSEIQR